MNSGHFVVALTGGVASGKSAVERRFVEHGVGVYDADRAARVAVEPGSSGLAAIVTAFGPEVLAADGALDRAAMRKRIFNDTPARQQLEAIVHPRVRQWLADAVAADRGAYCLVAIPLLVENIAHYGWVDRVLVVDAPVEVQIARLVMRDGIDDELARRMIANQATREQRLAIANDVINNNGEEALLDEAVAVLHAKYLQLA